MDSSVSVDSVASCNTMLSTSLFDMDSRSLDFTFDSIEVFIQRQSSLADSPEVMKVKVANGRILDRKTAQRDSIAAFNAVDSVAFKKSTAMNSAEHSATTRIYDPPNVTILIFIAAICAIVYIWRRFR